MIGGSQAGSDTLTKMTAREIADDLTERIRAGEYQPTAQLRFADLEALYDVRKPAIKRAMALLRDRGLVEDWPGLGVFVTDPASR